MLASGGREKISWKEVSLGIAEMLQHLAQAGRGVGNGLEHFGHFLVNP